MRNTSSAQLTLNSAPASGGPPRLEALSGLRFLAVAWVVVRHLGEPSFEHVPFVFERCRRHAFLLMPLFFVMSGFVLSYVYGEPIRSGRLDDSNNRCERRS